MKILSAEYAISLYFASEVLEDTQVKYKIISSLRFFTDYLKSFYITDLREVTKTHLEGFVKHLSTLKTKRTDKPFSKQTKVIIYLFIKKIFTFLYIHDLILINPCDQITVNFQGIQNIRKAFTTEQIAILLDSIPIDTFTGLRARTFFELMYGSGLRKMELINMTVDDVNIKERELIIRKSKYKKSRIVPLLEAALLPLQIYLQKTEKIHTHLKSLFISFKTGKGMSKATIEGNFRTILKKCDLDNQGFTIHSIRHSTATHLLEAGVNVRYVQELLGHRFLSTTQKYIHLTINHLKPIYKQYHPRENEYYKEFSDSYEEEIETLTKKVLTNRNNKKSSK